MSKQDFKEMSVVSPVEGGRRPTGTGETKATPKRFWAQHKSEAVLRLLRGENIETLSRELGVTAAKLSQWRDAFLAGGADSLKKRSAAEEAEYKRLNEKIGEQTMEIELLREKIRLLEAKDPLGWRRSRK
jgi:transposase-like protein